MVYCGSNVEIWEAFSGTLQVYQHIKGINSTLPYLFDRQRSDRYHECRLLNLLEACQASKCTDPRDKVYGLLGLANDCKEVDLVVDYAKTIYDVYKDVITFHSSRMRTQQSILPSRRDLDVVRFSQMLQKSLQNSLGAGNISPLQSTSHNHIQPQFIMVTGVYAGRIAEIEQPLLLEPSTDQTICLPSDTIGVSLPIKFDDQREVPWSSSEFGATALESDVEDWKTQLSDILFGPPAGPSTSATALSQQSTGTEALLSRLPELTQLDLEKVSNISSKLSYISCKCHDHYKPPSTRRRALSIDDDERPHKRPRNFVPARQSHRHPSRIEASNSVQKLPFHQDSKKEINDMIGKTIVPLSHIPDNRQHVPSIITYEPRNGISDLRVWEPQPPFVGIGPPNSHTGDIILQFMECDVAVVIRPVRPSTESTSDNDSGGTCTTVFKYYEVVGRALLLGTTNENHYLSSMGSVGKHKFRFPRHTALNNVQDQFSCYFDVETLWALTR